MGNLDVIVFVGYPGKLTVFLGITFKAIRRAVLGMQNARSPHIFRKRDLFTAEQDTEDVKWT